MNPRLDLIGRALDGRVNNVVLLEAVDSTHSAALRLIQQMDDEGLALEPTVLVADRQDQGMGRGGRSWISPSGGLYLSWLRSGLGPELVGLLPMLAAAAAFKAVSSFEIPDLGLKWPNDLLVGTAKLAGILVHARHGEIIWATVGLGLNVAAAPTLEPEMLRPAVAMAELVAGAEVDSMRAELAVCFVEHLNDSVVDPGSALETWRNALIHQSGDKMKLRLASGEELQGLYRGLSPEGFLRLEVGGEERVLTGGDIIDGGGADDATH